MTVETVGVRKIRMEIRRGEPLTFDGEDPTYRLLGERFFRELKPGAWFCSAGRGEVVNRANCQKSTVCSASDLAAVTADRDLTVRAAVDTAVARGGWSGRGSAA